MVKIVTIALGVFCAILIVTLVYFVVTDDDLFTIPDCRD